MLANLLSILLWLPALAVKLALAAIGLVVVPFTHPFKNPIYGNREHPVPPLWFVPWPTRMIDLHLPEKEWVWELRDRLEDYIWRAIRNPVNNLRYYFEEPEPDYVAAESNSSYARGALLQPSFNPDWVVRQTADSWAWRFVRSGLFSEFWYLRYSERFDRYFEFRIGWKFSGVPGFAPTIQLRFGRT